MNDEDLDKMVNPPSVMESQPRIRSLKELIDQVSGRTLKPEEGELDAGFAETIPFPFLALVGQPEMKLALILSLINPFIGGVLLVGPRGTGKTTAVRSLVDLLPQVPRSLCYYGCMPEDIEAGGIDAVCPECARKYGEGEPLAVLDRVRLVELPLNARLQEVVGGVDEYAAMHDRLRLRRGILSQADRNILYIDEVNLLANEVVDAILDAAAQGSYTVRRGPISATYRSKFVLIGSMNPEEGQLRPQIMDRFGLRVIVQGLQNLEERLEAYRRVQAYQNTPRHVILSYAEATSLANAEIQVARDLLSRVVLPDTIARIGLQVIKRLQIDSLRAEITMFEAARAHAAADGRTQVSYQDLLQVAPMSLRMRRSAYMSEYVGQQESENREISETFKETFESSYIVGDDENELYPTVQKEKHQRRQNRTDGA
jgi:magnesium chelatase subunit I